MRPPDPHCERDMREKKNKTDMAISQNGSLQVKTQGRGEPPIPNQYLLLISSATPFLSHLSFPFYTLASLFGSMETLFNSSHVRQCAMLWLMSS